MRAWRERGARVWRERGARVWRERGARVWRERGVRAWRGQGGRLPLFRVQSQKVMHLLVGVSPIIILQ